MPGDRLTARTAGEPGFADRNICGHQDFVDIGDGPACRSTSAPASGCRSARPRSPFNPATALTLFRKSRTTLPQANRLIISVQPEESIFLQFDAKIPGPVVTTQQVDMRFSYADYFGVENRTGYETLLYDAMVGDNSLFKRSDMIEAGWALVQPVLDAWGSGPARDLHFYAAGDDGPDAADAMMEQDRREWRPLT